MPENPTFMPIEPVPGWTSAQLDARVDDAHRQHQRVLATWASDLLELRRTGARQPGWPSKSQRATPDSAFRHAA